MRSLEWIILRSTRYQRSKIFYRDILHLPVLRDVPDEEFTQFTLENCFVAIYGAKFYDALIGKTGNDSNGNAIYTFAQVENVDREVATLKAAGVRFIKDPQTQPWGQKTAYFTDPDGHIWEIQQWMKSPANAV